jgi:hypothetical protein
MSGRRAAAIALSLVMDLADRLDAAGVTADKAPALDEAVAQVWPLAKRLAKLEKAAGKAGDSAARARTATLDCVAGRFAAAAGVRQARPEQQPSAPVRWQKLDVRQWRVELVPCPAADREREVA